MSEEENKSTEQQADENTIVDSDAASEQVDAENQSELDANTDDAKLPNENELGAIYDVPVQVTAVLGKASLHVNQLLKLGRGAVVELDRKVGEAIDVFVNNRLVARGEIVVMDDDHIGVTMTEIIKTEAAG